MVDLRTSFLVDLKTNVLFERARKKDGTFTASVADSSSAASAAIAREWGKRISEEPYGPELAGQTAGTAFQGLVKDFVEKSLNLLSPFHQGNWIVGIAGTRGVAAFDQYFHLAQFSKKLQKDRELRTMFGSEYLVKPDIVVFRHPAVPDALGGRPAGRKVAMHSPYLSDALNGGKPTLHASISCKITMRSDRAQNTRTEALNLIRNRKGRLPHVVAVTAEPMPSRLESLAIGTGDLDCVYHAGLYELIDAVSAVSNSKVGRKLRDLVDGRRLRDISDLPLDLIL